jgi:hypothetical protein
LFLSVATRVGDEVVGPRWFEVLVLGGEAQVVSLLARVSSISADIG